MDGSRELGANMWGCMNAIRGAMSRWHGDQYSANERQILDCEMILTNMLSRSKPTGQWELLAFQEENCKLLNELNKLRMMEESM